MLDVQRHRPNSPNEHRTFARNIIIGHLAFGLLIPILLLFHKLYMASFVVILWYLISIALVAGMMSSYEGCRPALAVLFWAIAIGGALYLREPLPALKDGISPILPRTFFPLWCVAANILYFSAGILLLKSVRVKRATAIGFALW